MTDKSDLGPLPSVDQNALLEERSVRALQAALPIAHLALRDERGKDYGVDFSLEVLLDGAATNLRSQVQLKARSGTRNNQDGSVSLTDVEPSNLNYLLFGPSPLYVLYRPEFDQLLFVWARDEVARLNSENSSWQSQKTVTLRFRETLTPVSSLEVRNRILREQQLGRRIQDTLSQLSDRAYLAVDPTELSVETDADALRVVEASGLLLVSHGFPSKLLELAAQVPPVRRTPRLHLAVAYANVQLGHYPAASASLVDLQLSDPAGTDVDQAFLSYLRLTVDLSLGKVTAAEFETREAELRLDATGLAALQYELQEVQRRLLSTTDDAVLDTVASRLDPLIAELAEYGDIAWPIVARARILRIEHAFGRWITTFVRKAMLSQGGEFWRLNVLKGGDPVRDIVQQVAEWAVLEARLNTEIAGAAENAHSPLLCEALLVRATARVGLLTQLRLLEHLRVPTIPLPDSEGVLLRDANRALEVAEQAGLLENVLRAKLLLADYHELINEPENARDLARSVLGAASALGLGRLVEHAESHVRGETTLSTTLRELDDAASLDEDELAAEMSDDDISRHARQVLNSLGLPNDRYRNLVSESERARAVAALRLNECQHFNTIEHLGHTKSLRTFYAIEPRRTAICERRGLESLLPHSDWRMVISAFRAANCEGCELKSPKK